MGSIATNNNDHEDITEPLVPESSPDDRSKVALIEEDEESKELVTRIWIETNKLWKVIGLAIYNHLVSYYMNVITQAFIAILAKLNSLPSPLLPTLQ